jgi:hypothetical protein
LFCPLSEHLSYDPPAAFHIVIFSDFPISSPKEASLFLINSRSYILNVYALKCNCFNCVSWYSHLTDLERFARGETSPDETVYITAYLAWMTKHSGYADIQSKAPLALGQAMMDSPVRYAGWILQAVRAVSDG